MKLSKLRQDRQDETTGEEWGHGRSWGVAGVCAGGWVRGGNGERERETERERDKERGGKRDRNRQRHRERERQRAERQRETETERQTETETHRETEREEKKRDSTVVDKRTREHDKPKAMMAGDAAKVKYNKIFRKRRRQYSKVDSIVN